MDVIITFMFLFLAVAYFWQATRAKDLACRQGKQYCQRIQVQFLDDTVVQSRVRPGKDKRGNPCWVRDYNFEFATDGRERYKGQMTLEGYVLRQIELEAHSISHNELEDQTLH